MLSVKKGEEKYMTYYSEALKIDLVQYDYRDHDGILFSTVTRTIEEARKRKDKWVADRAKLKSRSKKNGS